MKSAALRVATACGHQFLGLQIMFLALAILRVEGTPNWVYGAVGGFIFCFALAAQGGRKPLQRP